MDQVPALPAFSCQKHIFGDRHPGGGAEFGVLEYPGQEGGALFFGTLGNIDAAVEDLARVNAEVAANDVEQG